MIMNGIEKRIFEIMSQQIMFCENVNSTDVMCYETENMIDCFVRILQLQSFKRQPKWVVINVVQAMHWL